MSGLTRTHRRPESVVSAFVLLLALSGAASAADDRLPLVANARPVETPDMELLEFLGGGDATSGRQTDPLSLLEEVDDMPATAITQRRTTAPEVTP